MGLSSAVRLIEDMAAIEESNTSNGIEGQPEANTDATDGRIDAMHAYICHACKTHLLSTEENQNHVLVKYTGMNLKQVLGE